MPIYEYKCPVGHTFERVSSIKDYVSNPSCEICGETTHRLFSPPFMAVDYTDRTDYSETIGVSHFSNRSQKAEYMRRKGLIDVGGPEMRESVMKRMKDLRERKADTGSLSGG